MNKKIFKNISDHYLSVNYLDGTRRKRSILSPRTVCVLENCDRLLSELLIKSGQLIEIQEENIKIKEAEENALLYIQA